MRGKGLGVGGEDCVVKSGVRGGMWRIFKLKGVAQNAGAGYMLANKTIC